MKSQRAPVGTEAHGAYVGGAHVIYHTINTTDDVYYQKECAICRRRAILGSIIVTIDAAGHSDLAMCGPCLAKMAEFAPEDMRYEKVQKRIEKLAVESPLVGWINEAETSMDSS